MIEPEPATTSNNDEQNPGAGAVESAAGSRVEGPIRWAGVDWFWSEHAVCVIDDSGVAIERFTVTHTTLGLSTLVTRLHRHQITGVTIERGDGPSSTSRLPPELSRDCQIGCVPSVVAEPSHAITTT